MVIQLPFVTVFFIVMTLACPLHGLADSDLFTHQMKAYTEKLTGLNGQERFKLILDELGEANFYKLIIDKADHQRRNPKHKSQNPERVYDEAELGYFESMKSAFNSIGETLDKPLTFDDVIELHDKAIKGVKHGSRMYDKEFEQGLSDSMLDTVPVDQIDDEVRSDWERLKLISQDPADRTRYLAYNCVGTREVASNLKQLVDHFIEIQEEANKIEFQSLSEQELLRKIARTKLKKYFKAYHLTLKKAHTPDKKFGAMADLLRALEVFHIFPDGNQRTTVFLVLNKLLIQNHFPPVILDDPTLFNGHRSTTFIIKAIRRGIQNYLDAVGESKSLRESKNSG